MYQVSRGVCSDDEIPLYCRSRVGTSEGSCLRLVIQIGTDDGENDRIQQLARDIVPVE